MSELCRLASGLFPSSFPVVLLRFRRVESSVRLQAAVYGRVEQFLCHGEHLRPACDVFLVGRYAPYVAINFFICAFFYAVLFF